jgi:hypothetical protein
VTGPGRGGGRAFAGLALGALGAALLLGIPPGAAGQGDPDLTGWEEEPAASSFQAWEVEAVVAGAELVAVVGPAEGGIAFPLDREGGGEGSLGTLLDLRVEEVLWGDEPAGGEIRFLEPPWSSPRPVAVGPGAQVVFLRRLSDEERAEVHRAVEQGDLGLPSGADDAPLREALRLPADAWTFATPDAPWQSWVSLDPARPPGRLAYLLREAAGVGPGGEEVANYLRHLLSLRDPRTDPPLPEELDPFQRRVLAMPMIDPGG